MKIQNINFINFNNFGGEAAISKPAYESNFDYNNTLHPQEILGRSQVNFTGGSFKFSENDRKFLDSAASNLRLSDEDKKILEDETANYLKENGIDSFDYLEDNDKAEDQGVYCERISKALDLSDGDFNIFCTDFIQRVCFYYGSEEYAPEERKYDKDLEVLDNILGKYNIGQMTMYSIFDVMKMEAEAFECDTIFDLFKSGMDPENSLTFQCVSKNISEDLACDLLIDFAKAANKDEQERHSEVNKTKMRDEFFDAQSDMTIVKQIGDRYNIDEDDFEQIIEEIEKRHSGEKSPDQLAFELSDKYDLPSGSEEFIKETIITSDSLAEILKQK